MSRRLVVFDTSGPHLLVALWQGSAWDAPGQVVWQESRTFETGHPGHAAQLVPTMREGLAAAGWLWAQVDGIGTTIGPGSYTGLRIGLAAAKSLALAGDVALAGVGTLSALAFPWAGLDTVVLAWLDARRGQAFAGVFAEEGAATPTLPIARMAQTAALDSAILAAQRTGRHKLVLVGDVPASDGIDETIRAAGLEGIRPKMANRITAAALSCLAAQRLAAGSDDPLALVPDYGAAPHIGPSASPA